MSAIPFFNRPNFDAAGIDTLQREIANLSKEIDTLSLKIASKKLQTRCMEEPLKTTSTARSKSIHFKTRCPLDLDNAFGIEIVFFSPFVEAFNAYIEARSNGNDEDLPQHPFPSGGFEKLKGEDYNLKYFKDIYGQNGLEANAVRYPHDKKKFSVFVTDLPEDKKQFTFSAYNANGESIPIQGFSWVADKEKGFPDEQGKYCGYVEYSDENDENIRNWMQEKDANYTARCRAFFKEIERLEQNMQELKATRNVLSEQLEKEERRRTLDMAISNLEEHKKTAPTM